MGDQWIIMSYHWNVIHYQWMTMDYYGKVNGLSWVIMKKSIDCHELSMNYNTLSMHGYHLSMIMTMQWQSNGNAMAMQWISPGHFHITNALSYHQGTFISPGDFHLIANVNHSCVLCFSGGVFVDFGKGIFWVWHECVLGSEWGCGVVVEFAVVVVLVVALSGRWDTVASPRPSITDPRVNNKQTFTHRRVTIHN